MAMQNGLIRPRAKAWLSLSITLFLALPALAFQGTESSRIELEEIAEAFEHKHLQNLLNTSDEAVTTAPVDTTQAVLARLMGVIQDPRQNIQDLSEAVVDLLKLLDLASPLPSDIPAYNRQKHFGGWINNDANQNCYKTRDEVLIRDSSTPVTFLPGNTCRVNEGQWADPFSGAKYKQARSLHVDHMVPLKNAYISGAWSWRKNRRCHFGNYLDNDYHLMSVAAGQNLSKGDKTPAQWLPSDATYHCSYIRNWMKIKLIWDLQISEDEAEGIRAALHESGCDADRMTMAARELSQQIPKSQQPQEKCLQVSAEVL